MLTNHIIGVKFYQAFSHCIELTVHECVFTCKLLSFVLNYFLLYTANDYGVIPPLDGNGVLALSFSPEVSRQCVDVTITEDSVSEVTEELAFSLPAFSGSTPRQVIVILDSDGECV